MAKEGERFPDVRVGVAHGPATTRGGDWFGATVNVASRVTEIARPGRILATEAVRDLAPDEAWQRRRRRANLKGVDGRVRLFSLDRRGRRLIDLDETSRVRATRRAAGGARAEASARLRAL